MNSTDLSPKLRGFPPLTCEQLLTIDQYAEAIDFYLAKEVCEDLQCLDECLFYLIILLNQALRQGHSRLCIAGIAETYYPQQDVAILDVSERYGQCFLFPSQNELHHYLNTILNEQNDNRLIVYEEQALYLRRHWHYEERLANTLLRLVNMPTMFELDSLKTSISRVFPEIKDRVDWQKVAVCNSALQQFSIIAGGPGTGKTTTVCKLLVVLIDMLRQRGITAPHISLVAPTGKAAQRLLESIQSKKVELLNQDSTLADIIQLIPDESSTIHRLLGFLPHHYAFKFNRSNPLNIDILLVDEVSMIDLPLMTKLMDAVTEKTLVIMLGDPDQLPSVEVGSVLADIITRPHPGYSQPRKELLAQLTGTKPDDLSPTKSECHLGVPLPDCFTLLTESYRFKSGGEIGLLAASIIQGNSDKSWQLLQTANTEIYCHEQTFTPTDNHEFRATKDTDFFNWLKPQINRLFENMKMQERPDDALSMFAQFRILAATKNGVFGIHDINEAIENHLLLNHLIDSTQNAFNHNPEVPAHYHCKPIMITENHYQTGLFNGDIGIIWQVQPNKLKAAFISADNRIKWVSLAKLPKHEAVFAMTIHKTQGSEFDHVCMVLPERPNRVLSRELLYTGVTRAKTRLTVFSSQFVWQTGVQKLIERNTGLRNKLTGR